MSALEVQSHGRRDEWPATSNVLIARCLLEDDDPETTSAAETQASWMIRTPVADAASLVATSALSWNFSLTCSLSPMELIYHGCFISLSLIF
jgi:hypothetical protein